MLAVPLKDAPLQSREHRERLKYSNSVAIHPSPLAAWRIAYTNGSTAGDLANALANAITSRGSLGVGAIANGVSLKLSGERSIAIDPLVKLIDVAGKTIFVDKSAGPNADGSLAKPFNNISGSGVPNAFSSTFPGDIVRIVGNGGVDNSNTN